MKRAITPLLRLCLALCLCLALVSCQQDEGSRMFDQAKELWRAEKYEDAIQNLVALTKAFPDHPLVDDAYFWIGTIYEHYLGNSEQAVRFYRNLNKAQENSEYRNQAMLGLARLYAKEGEEGKQRAILIHERLQKTNLSLEEREKSLYVLAQLYLDAGQYEKCRVTLKNLVLANPESPYAPKAYHQIGYSYYLEGTLDLAEIAFLEADAKFQHSNASLASAITLADIYEEQDRLRAAIQVYQSIMNRLERREVFYQLAKDRIDKLTTRLRQTNTG